MSATRQGRSAIVPGHRAFLFHNHRPCYCPDCPVSGFVLRHSCDANIHMNNEASVTEDNPRGMFRSRQGGRRGGERGVRQDVDRVRKGEIAA